MNRHETTQHLEARNARAVLVDRLNSGSDAQPEALVALGLLYVGDELAKATGMAMVAADELKTLNEGVAAVGRGMVGLTNAWATVATSVVRHVGDFAEQVAPATRNGAGEVLGRTVSVAAALRADGES